MVAATGGVRAVERGVLSMRLKAILATAAAAFVALAGGTAGAETQTAVFAGGCFWCMEEAFDKVPGVVETTSGYAGGATQDPTYEEVSSGGTGHYEVVQVTYDPAKASYEQLLESFWHNVDPFDARGQFCDKGSQYKSAIFVADEKERTLAEASKKEVEGRFPDMTVATAILPAATFYPAEDYHQNFYQTNEGRYQYYKFGCGRAQRLEQIWGKPAA
jgi:peptide-methionine (S)-S-oxide reductase